SLPSEPSGAGLGPMAVAAVRSGRNPRSHGRHTDRSGARGAAGREFAYSARTGRDRTPLFSGDALTLAPAALAAVHGLGADRSAPCGAGRDLLLPPRRRA